MKRAFIGPIGDDIPSIFPLMAGIVLFIATIAYANQEFATKTEQIKLRKAGLDLSYIAIENGYMDMDNFPDKCRELLTPASVKNGVYFAVMLRNCDQLALPSFEGTVICSRTFETAPTLNKAFFEKKVLSTFNYPVATDCDTGLGEKSGLGTIEILTWYK
ncbi:MAG: hypothetical protein WC408_03545 [Candidatus Micrarchaeia archaeon]|jgi:hypothetical protein